MIEFVTQERRHSIMGARHGMIRRGQVFTIVTVNDYGPYDLPSFPTVDGRGGLLPAKRTARDKRWHTALLGDTLFWLDHELFQFSKLVADAK